MRQAAVENWNCSFEFERNSNLELRDLNLDHQAKSNRSNSGVVVLCVSRHSTLRILFERSRSPLGSNFRRSNPAVGNLPGNFFEHLPTCVTSRLSLDRVCTHGRGRRMTQSTTGNYIVYNFLARETSQWNKSLYENVYCSREPMVVRGSRVKRVIYTIKKLY